MRPAEADSNELEDRLRRAADLFARAVEALSDVGPLAPETAEALVHQAQSAQAELELAESALGGRAAEVTDALDHEWRRTMEEEDGETGRTSRLASLLPRSSRHRQAVPSTGSGGLLLPHLRHADAVLEAAATQRKAVGDQLVLLESSVAAVGEAAKTDRRALDGVREKDHALGHRELELRDALSQADGREGEDRPRLRSEHEEAVTAHGDAQRRALELVRQVEADEGVLESFEALAKAATRHLSVLDLTVALTKTEIERAVLLLAAWSDCEALDLSGYPARAMELMRDGLLSAQDVAARRQQAARAFADRLHPATSGEVRPEDGSTT